MTTYYFRLATADCYNNNKSSLNNDDVRTFLYDYGHSDAQFCHLDQHGQSQGCFAPAPPLQYPSLLIIMFLWLCLICLLSTVAFCHFFRRRWAKKTSIRKSPRKNDNNRVATRDIISAAARGQRRRHEFQSSNQKRRIKEEEVMPDEEWDDDILTRMLSAVYQPFVDVAPVAIMEAERAMNAYFQGDLTKFVRDFLTPAVDLLGRLRDLTKAELSVGNKRSPSIGWPLCTKRRVIVHLGRIVDDPDTFNGVQLENGDFYVSVILASSSSDSVSVGSSVSHDVDAPQHGVTRTRVALNLQYYNSGVGFVNFDEIALSPVDFVNLFTRLGDDNWWIRFRRCISSASRSGGRMQIMPSVVDDVQADAADDGQRGSCSMSFMAQNEEYFSFPIKGNDNCSRMDSGEAVRAIDEEEIRHIDDDEVPMEKNGYVSSSNLPNFVDFTRNALEPRVSGFFAENFESTTSRQENKSRVFDQAAKETSESFVGRCPRKIVDVRDELMRSGCVRYSGTVTWEQCQICAVELSLTTKCLTNDSFSSLDFAKAFVYIQYVHKFSSSALIELNNSKKFAFVLFVDCRRESSEEEIDETAVFSLAASVDLLLSLRPNVSCRLVVVQADERVRKMFQDNPSVSDDLESFMDTCRNAAKFYINAMQRLKKVTDDNSTALLWMLDDTDLQDRSVKICDDLNQSRKMHATLEPLMETGKIELEKLAEFVSQNETVPHYQEAVTKVTAFFEEVCRVMLKYKRESDRFSSNVDDVVRIRSIVFDSNSSIEWLESEAKQALSAFHIRTNGTKNAKRTQQDFSTFVLEVADPRLEKISNVHAALVDVLSKKSDDRSTVEQRNEIESVESRLSLGLESFRTSLGSTRKLVDNTVACYELLDEAYEWALDSMKLAASVGKMLNATLKTGERNEEQIRKTRDKVEDYLRSNPRSNENKLETLRRWTGEIGDERLILQCQAVDVRCLDTENMLVTQKMRLHDALGDGAGACAVKERERRNSGDYEQPSSARLSLHDAPNVDDFAANRRRSYAGSCSSASLHEIPRSCNQIESSLTQQKSSVDLFGANDTLNSSDLITEDFTDKVVSSISTTMLRKKIAERRAASSQQLLNRKKSAPEQLSPPSVDEVDKKSRRPFRKFIRRASAVDVSPAVDERRRHPSLDSLSSVSEESHHSSSLSAKSLPMTIVACSSSSSINDTPPPYPAPLLPPEADEKLRVSTPPPDCSPSMRMQYNVVNELLQTEIAYVRSLQYVIENYIPEMQRTDLPHSLRGQRRPIFGNIEKIHEFHVGHFLPDLTRFCLKSSELLGLHVAKCFLRHRQKFHLYALYNKNKPNSDALISECAGVFFRTKQLLLGDKLDLWSYLLKPVQRISKYSLFVQKLIKACPSDDQEQIEALRAVEEMLMSQLQHGNDLLAMDLIRNCDLNLKEQGKVLRQDEFVVYEGRNGRKCVRRIFLFEHLVLFAKPRKIRGTGGATTSEIYIYKNSIKMSDLGLTENVGDCELKFELWFRRHTSDEVYLILAPNMSLKMAWITRVSNMLWQQAYVNRDLKISEMSLMGTGPKVCMDLNSEDRIQDRAVSNGLLSKAGRSRTTLPSLSEVDRYNLTTKRPHSLISIGSSSSSANSSMSGSGGRQSVSATTPLSLESGIFVDLSTLEEYPDDPTVADASIISVQQSPL